MKLHANARLTVHARILLVERLQAGEKPAAVAAALGVSERTVYKWRNRYQRLGTEGLRDRSSRPRRCAHVHSRRVIRRVCRLRRRRLVAREIAEQTGVPRSTVSRILRRHGLHRLKNLESKPAVVRYEREAPGELLHVDIKKLGRIQRVGHRIHGDPSRRSRGAGWEYAHAAVDDHTRLAYVEVLEDERKDTVAGFLRRAAAWYRDQGVVVERVMTDRGPGYCSHAFAESCSDLGLRHIKTKPYTPKTNGKVERFIQTLTRKWAYGATYKTSAARTRALPSWLDHYNHNRPHQGISGLTPAQRLERATEQRHET
ncbi:MAG: IS481 family transposase [Acidobacteriota bacterium]